MPLKYALFENNLTPDPTDYMAVAQPEGSKTQEQIIDLMISRGSTVTKAEALSVMEEYALAVEQVVKDGGSITTPLFNVSSSVSGVFTSKDDSYDAARHQIRIRVTPGNRLRKSEAFIRAEKVAATKPLPILQVFKDVASNTKNEQLTSGGVGHIVGSRLKFDETDAQQGVFFIATGGEEYRADTLIRHKPAEVIFMIPTLPKGYYALEIRCIMQNTKELRKGGLPETLTVI